MVNRLKGDSVEMDFTIFAKREGRRVRARRPSRHVQYIHTEENVERCLREADFTLVKKTGAFGDDGDKTRVNFICVRN